MEILILNGNTGFKEFFILFFKAGPRDKEAWLLRLKEEYQSLIKYVSNNKERYFCRVLNLARSKAAVYRYLLYLEVVDALKLIVH